MINTLESIRSRIVEYVLHNYVSSFTEQTMPLDESLVELGVIDSYGVVELISFLEETWSIAIADSEITKEKFGSINKMAKLVLQKTGTR